MDHIFGHGFEFRQNGFGPFHHVIECIDQLVDLFAFRAVLKPSCVVAAGADLSCGFCDAPDPAGDLFPHIPAHAAADKWHDHDRNGKEDQQMAQGAFGVGGIMPHDQQRAIVKTALMQEQVMLFPFQF